MRQVIIYQFKVYDPLRGEWIPARRWGTVAAICRLTNAVILKDTGVRTDESDLTSDFDGFTRPGFMPVLARVRLAEAQD